MAYFDPNNPLANKRRGALDALMNPGAMTAGDAGGVQAGSAANVPQTLAFNNPLAGGPLEASNGGFGAGAIGNGPYSPYGPNGNTGINGGKVPTAQPDQNIFNAQPSQQQPITPVAGRPFLLGFETSKLLDPNKGPGESGKYSAAAKAFGQSYLGGTDIGRGNLEPMLNSIKAQFPNARIVGDDKIDFGDGYGPVDVVGSDNSIRFQNTTNNPVYEAAYARGQQGQLGGGLAQAFGAAPHNTGPMAPGGGGGGGGAPATASSDPYASMGGGVYFPKTGQWVPANNQAALTAAEAANGGPGQPGGAPQTAQATTTAPTAPNVPGAPQAAPAGPVGPLPDYAPTPVDVPERLQLERIAAAQQFTGPTAEEAANDQGYRFVTKQGSDALQNAAAAKGLLRSGGTLKDLMAYNQDAASQQYDKVYGRRFGEYTTGLADRFAVGQANNASAAQGYGLSNQFRQAAQGANNANSLGAYQANVAARLGYGNLANEQTQTANAFTLGQGNLSLGNRQADISRELGLGNIGVANRNADISRELGLGQLELGRGNLGLGYYNADTTRMANQGQLGLGWANYGLNADQQQFNQGYSLANMGLTAAGAYGGYAGQYGANAGNYATQAGNAQAAGQVGSANAWAQGLGGVAAGVGGGLYGNAYYRGQ